MSFAFVAPLMLFTMLAALLATALFGYGFYRRRQLARTTWSPALLQLLAGGGRLKRPIKATLIVLAMAALSVALAKPQWGSQTEDIDRKGRDFLILLDVSISMLAQDAKPDRLTNGIEGIRDFVNSMRSDGGHRVALIAFAGRASPAAPLTVDYDLFINRLNDISTVSSIRRGSHIGDAIRQALYSFGTLSHEYTDIIIVSDGEDHGSGPLDAAKVAAGLGVSIHTVGIGDSTEGALIPYKVSDDSDYVKVNNTEIISRMQPGLLVEIARISGGQFVSVGTDQARLGDFYQSYLSKKPTRQIDMVASERRIHRFQWFIAAALLLLVLERLLSMSTNTTSPVQNSSSRFVPSLDNRGVATLSVFCVVALSYSINLPANVDKGGELIEQGNESYVRGDYHAAADRFAEAARLMPDNAVGHFNHATARFKLYDYAAAIEHFTVALQGADEQLASQINYNLGVVKHQQAIGNMMTFQDAMTPLESAVAYYRDSLEQQPDFTDARFNLELAHRLMQDLINQRVLPQANARTRDQKTSDNKGQLHKEDGNRPTEQLPDQTQQDQDKNSENPNGEVSSQQKQNNSQNQSALVQRGEASDLKPEDAMQEIELARQRSESMAQQRAQWRKARMESDSVEKFW